jgi:hypothetical protein
MKGLLLMFLLECRVEKWSVSFFLIWFGDVGNDLTTYDNSPYEVKTIQKMRMNSSLNQIHLA